MSVAVVSRFPFGYYLSVLELGNKAMPHAAVAARGQFAAQSPPPLPSLDCEFRFFRF